MKQISILLCSLLMVATSCTQKEEEQELDYDNMVMVDEEEEWIPAQEKHGKAIAGDLDPQEFMIQDPELKTENASEANR